MGYRYPAGAVRRLDDALLAAFGDRYIDLHGNAHRVELLENRFTRLRDGDCRLASPGASPSCVGSVMPASLDAQSAC